MITLTDKIWKTITGINREVNFAIEYLGDQENYGVPEYWSLPKNNRDDCDGFSILKQDLLKEKSIDSFIALCGVYNPLGDHAVIFVDTDRGTFVLDNRNDIVWNFADIDYTWLSREVDAPGSWGGRRWEPIIS